MRKYSAAIAPNILRVSGGQSLGATDNLTSQTPIAIAKHWSVSYNGYFFCQKHKLTRFFWSTTPSLIQTLQNPIMFAIITSVDNRSPTTAIWFGNITFASAAWLRKYSIIWGPQPGFFVECLSTLTPVAASKSLASLPSTSSFVPAELLTIKTRESG